MKYGSLAKSGVAAGLLIFVLCGSATAVLLIVDFFHPRKILLELAIRVPWVDTDINWETASPESQGMDGSKLNLLRGDLAARKTRAFLVVRHNKIVHEWYAQDYGPTKGHYTASLAKALVGGTALSVALSDKRIGLDDPAWRYIPAWKHDPLKSKITIRQLATHSSGLKNANKSEHFSGQENEWQEIYWQNRAKRFVIAINQTPMALTPGTRLTYSNPGINALAYAITSSLGGSPYANIYALLKDRIMGPLGIPVSAWRISYSEAYKVDGMKLYEIGGGGNYTARAAARVGQLMLNKGNWEGRQLIDADTVERVISYAGPSLLKRPKDHPGPGLGWWTNFDGVWSVLPHDAFVGAGRGHQIVLVVPSLDLVVVRFGGSLGDTSPSGLSGDYWSKLQEYLFEPLMDAIIG